MILSTVHKTNTMYINKFIFSVFAFAITSFAFGQKVTVISHNEKINGDAAEGYATELEGKKEEVETAWSKFLKDFGRPKLGASHTMISNPALGGTAYSTGVIYADVTSKNDNTRVWVGIKEGEWTVNDIGIVKKDLEKEVYRFGVKYYKDKIQAQIDEAQRAFDATTRQSQRLVNQNKDLTIQLGNNEQEKIRLEQQMEKNTFEHAVLLQKIENNKLSQDSVAQAGEQIKRVIEMHKERQQKVN